MLLYVQPQGPLLRRLSHLESDTGMKFRIIIASGTNDFNNEIPLPRTGFLFRNVSELFLHAGQPPLQHKGCLSW